MKPLRWPAALAAALLACSAVHAGTAATGLPPIFKDTPVALRPSRVVATLPKNTFLENLVVDAAGTVFVTSHLDGTLYRQRGNQLERFAVLPGKIAGIALAPRGGFVVTGEDAEAKPVLYRVDAAGGFAVAARLPQAVFLNGLTRLSGDVYLVADSYKGVIWRVDLAQPGAQATTWLESPLLARADAANPTPGANGIHRDGARVLVSNTAKQLLLAVPLQADGSAGAPAVLRERVNIDDFAVDGDGSILAATHIYQSLIRIAPDGAVTTLAGAEQGLTGSTAVAFGRAVGGKRRLYITTNGGMFLPPPGGVEVAKLVRVDVR